MRFNPDLHHRRSLRLQGYDYAQAGAYFVTVCAQDRQCVFGEIIDGDLRPTAAGQMVERWWAVLPSKFPSLDLDASVLMPNHWHGIVVLGDPPSSTTAAPALGAATQGGALGATTQGGPHRPVLGDVVRWFKTMSTNEYFRGVKEQAWPPVRGRLWQRNYYEHIIRDEAALTRIRTYIVTNPQRWAEDQENPWRGVQP